MPQEIIDLDAAGIFAPPITIRLAGREWRLPGDVPAPLYVKATQVMSIDPSALGPEEQNQLAIELHDEMLELFRQYQPDLERLPLPLRGMTAALTYIYGGGAEAATGEEGPTPAPSTTRATRSSQRTTARARSRRSRSST